MGGLRGSGGCKRMRRLSLDLLIRHHYEEACRRNHLRHQLEVRMKKLRIIMWTGLTVGVFYAYLQVIHLIHRIYGG